ncbi:MAG: nickel-dependent hydrogenase large subunit [Thiomicrorhabdus sp.]|nr:nickel-dependent hydrogenase large subunit [Thiomicrorhabdus sp.]MCF6346604.1 nickel-dependent hydrogenase large subunit [Thiomicrorhabdus sp.]
MSRMIVGPFNRVEGDLEITLDFDGDKVRQAEVNATLFRGFESMLEGRKASDVLIFAPRICGICSVSQSVAAATALSQIYGVTPTENGQKAINLMLANENAADLLTHFYLFFMPDFAREVYQDQPWFSEVKLRFKAMRGRSVSGALQARTTWLKMMGILAGRWPHTLAIQPGGSSRAIVDSETLQLTLLARQFRQFLEQQMLGSSLERFLGCQTEAEFLAWQSNTTSSDFGLFCEVARALELSQLGCSPGQLMSYGNYPDMEGGRTFASGIFDKGGRKILNPNLITEDTHYAHYQGSDILSPWADNVAPELDKAQAYSWCKAPRLDGNVMEVGALARQVMTQQPLINDLMARYGSNVYTRIVARVVELATIVTLVESWLETGFTKESAFCQSATTVACSKGMGLIEAARGGLGHWIELEGDQIKNFQVIAPTTWNFSPKDSRNVSGALEQALVGARKLPNEQTPVSVQHIVRSFDPCMVCTVH